MAVVTILGAGSWGTALATHLARLGHEVALWARNPEFSAQLALRGQAAASGGRRLDDPRPQARDGLREGGVCRTAQQRASTRDVSSPPTVGRATAAGTMPAGNAASCPRVATRPAASRAVASGSSRAGGARSTSRGTTPGSASRRLRRRRPPAEGSGQAQELVRRRPTGTAVRAVHTEWPKLATVPLVQ